MQRKRIGTRIGWVTLVVMMTAVSMARAETGRVDPAAALAAACADPACDACNGRAPLLDKCAPCDDWYAGSAFTTVNAFKGPIDVDDLNGNFGLSAGVNFGFATLPGTNLGVQAGTSVTGSNFKGSWYSGAGTRTQQFTTVGLFRRAEDCTGWNFGVAYDFLDDDYYTSFHFGQWRGLVGYQFNECNEVGVWATVPGFGTDVLLGSAANGFSMNRMQPFSQINTYWRHVWPSEATTEFRLGVPDNNNVGELILGAAATCPLTQRTSLIGGFSYVLPSVPGGNLGRAEEVWSLYSGIEILLGRGASNACRSRCAPVLPVADQGSFGVTRIR